MRRLKFVIGQRFGRLEVSGLDESRSEIEHRHYWVCECDCGETCSVSASNLKSGNTQSCGCLHREQLIVRSTTHGQRHSPVYGCWANMIQRCTNPSNSSFVNYGGRGINVCQEWFTFDGFLADMGSSYKVGLTIERRDNKSGSYCKENCYWATRRVQNRNKRNNRMIATPVGTMLLCDAVELSGLSSSQLAHRIAAGWPVGDLFRSSRIVASNKTQERTIIQAQ